VAEHRGDAALVGHHRVVGGAIALVARLWVDAEPRPSLHPGPVQGVV
jgi:hypothetical protein